MNDDKQALNAKIKEREIRLTGGTFNGLGLVVKENRHMIKPLNNHCLIEIIDEYAGVIRNNEQENVQKGVLRSASFTTDHLTASTGYRITDIEEYDKWFNENIGKTVYWQEYADTGNKLRFYDKQYVMVPFYRLIGVED